MICWTRGITARATDSDVVNAAQSGVRRLPARYELKVSYGSTSSSSIAAMEYVVVANVAGGVLDLLMIIDCNWILTRNSLL